MEMPRVKMELNVNSGITVLGFLGMFAGGITAWNNLQAAQEDLLEKYEKAEKASTERISKNDQRFDRLETKIAPFDNLQYRTSAIEAQVQAINARFDRGFELISVKIEGIERTITAVGTKVELLGQQLEFYDPKKRASFQGVPRTLDN